MQPLKRLPFAKTGSRTMQVAGVEDPHSIANESVIAKP